MRRGSSAVVAAVVLAVLAAAVAGVVWFELYRSADIPAGRSVELTIPKGSSTRAIAVQLTNAGVVANANMFRLRARLDGADGRMKSGSYAFKTGSDYGQVILRLEEGPTVRYVDVVIPEGFRVSQMAARMQSQAGIPAAEFERLALHEASRFKARHSFLESNATDSLEGYLFPKTYRVKKGMRASEVIDMMLVQFETETADLDMTYARSKNLTLHDVVTAASIVEKEAILEKQRALVSSVIYNRLKTRMYLGMDSVLGYVLGSKTLTLKDLRIDNPYNTYVNKGLPPGPICSPGMSSLKAAAHPAKTSYLYFVGTAKDGTLTFTVGYADFLKAKAVSKRVFGK